MNPTLEKPYIWATELIMHKEVTFIHGNFLCTIEEGSEEDYVFDLYKMNDEGHWVPHDGGFFTGTAREAVEFIMLN